MRIRLAALAATAIAAATACGNTDAAAPAAGSRAAQSTTPASAPAASTGAASGPTASEGPTSSGAPLATSLTITFDADGKGTATETWTLRCDPPGGDHPDAAAACAQLAKADKPFDPVPADAMCTEQYGGPSVATLKGTWDGKPVDAKYTRENGCHISRWDAVAQVIPGKPTLQ